VVFIFSSALAFRVCSRSRLFLPTIWLAFWRWNSSQPPFFSLLPGARPSSSFPVKVRYPSSRFFLPILSALPRYVTSFARSILFLCVRTCYSSCVLAGLPPTPQHQALWNGVFIRPLLRRSPPVPPEPSHSLGPLPNSPSRPLKHMKIKIASPTPPTPPQRPFTARLSDSPQSHP